MNRSRISRYSILLLCSLIATGCSVRKEGIHVGPTTYEFGSIISKRCASNSCPQKVMLIGEVSAYRKLGKTPSIEYGKYKKAAEKFDPKNTALLDKGEFERSIEGWTNIRVYYIPLVLSGSMPALVAIDQKDQITFPSTVETFVVQGTGDLVLARSNPDGVFVVEKRLCSTKSDFSNCRKKYSRGMYDAQTGIELNRMFNIKKNGKVIDPQTLEVLKNH